MQVTSHPNVSTTGVPTPCRRPFGTGEMRSCSSVSFATAMAVLVTGVLALSVPALAPSAQRGGAGGGPSGAAADGHC